MEYRIITYQAKDEKDLKAMSIELQRHLVDIDFWKVFKLDKDYKAKSLPRLMKDVKEHHGKIFLAKADTKTVGFIAGYILHDKTNIVMYPLRRGYVDELYLKKAYRGLGLGTKLLQKFEKYCLSKKCDTLGLNALVANDMAIDLYLKKGFEKRSVFLAKALNKKVRK